MGKLFRMSNCTLEMWSSCYSLYRHFISRGFFEWVELYKNSDVYSRSFTRTFSGAYWDESGERA